MAILFCSPLIVLILLCCKDHPSVNRLKERLRQRFVYNRAVEEEDEIAEENIQRQGNRINQRNREGFTDLQMMRLIQVCGKTLQKDDLVDAQTDRYHLESSCSICLGEWEDKQNVIEFKLCPHSFHGECIQDWLKIKSTCPLCKMNKKAEIGVEEEEIEQNNDYQGNELQQFIQGQLFEGNLLRGQRNQPFRQFMRMNNDMAQPHAQMMFEIDFDVQHLGLDPTDYTREQMRLILMRELVARELIRRVRLQMAQLQAFDDL